MQDALSAVLENLYVSGTVFARAELRAPWAVHTRGAENSIFHAVVHGGCWLLPEDGEPVSLTSGDVAVLPHGTAHVMCDDPSTRPEPIADLLEYDDDAGVSVLDHGGEGSRTAIICGTFRFRQGVPNPLLDGLPGVLHVDGRTHGLADWLDVSLRLIRDELERARPGRHTIIARITDALLIQLMRHVIDTLPSGSQSWLIGLRDDRVARALGAIHDRPSHSWTANELARTAGMSRSAFYTRFKELVGTSPATYLKDWRMNVAALALRREPITVAEAAGRAGYASVASFSRAFKTHTGRSPSDFRDHGPG